MIPLGTDRPLRRTAVVTPALIGLTVAAWAAERFLAWNDPLAAERLGETLAVVGGEGFRPWQPLTYAFLHADVWHLLGNMLFLWVFGRAVEDRFGRPGFLALYVFGAIVSGLAHAVFERDLLATAIWRDSLGNIVPPPADEPGATDKIYTYRAAIGASGAVSAVSGAFFVLFPFTRIKVLGWMLMGVWWAPAWWFIGISIAWNLLAQAGGLSPGVALIAHLGGYALGIGLSVALLWAKVFPREPYDLFTIARQAKRRADFRAIAQSQRLERTRPARAAASTAASRGAAARSEQLAARRAAVTEALGRGDMPQALAAYRHLLDAYPDDRAAATLHRDALYRLATHATTQATTQVTTQASTAPDPASAALAADAWSRFIEAYPADRETPQVQLLLARLYLRDLARPADAALLLRRCIDSARNTDPRDTDLRDIAEAMLAELPPGLASPPPAAPAAS